MGFKIMYPAINNSPVTTLAAALTTASTTIELVDASVLPAGPGICTIGTDDTAELVLYTGISGNSLTGCTRGFNSTLIKAWDVGAKVYRAFTAYDHQAFCGNIEELQAENDSVGLNIRAYQRRHGIISSAGSWDQLDPSSNTYDNYRHIIVPINPGDTFSMTAGDRSLYWIVLKSYDPVAGSATDQFATGYTKRNELKANNSIENQTAPDNAKYLFLIVNWGKTNGVLNDNYPVSLVINGVDLCAETGKGLLKAAGAAAALQTSVGTLQETVAGNQTTLDAISTDIGVIRNGQYTVPWQSGGVNSLNVGSTIKSSANAKRVNSGELRFGEDVSITTADGYTAVLALVDENGIITSSIKSYRAYDKYKIDAGQRFWVVIQHGDDDITDEAGAEGVAIKSYAVNLETLDARLPARKWVALGDSITEKYYSFIPEETGDTAAFKYEDGQFFYLVASNVKTLYQATAAIAVGDAFTSSNCAESSEEHPWGRSGTDAKLVWPALVAEQLGWELTNAGVGGTGFIDPVNGTENKTAADQKRGYYVARTTDYTGADLVTVAYGCNDWKAGVTLGSIDSPIDGDGSGNPTTIYGGIKAVVEAIAERAPMARIVMITPFNALGYQFECRNSAKYGLGHAYNGVTLENVCQAIVDVCGLYGIPYIDMTHHSIINMLNIERCLPDGVHPSVEAHAALAKELAEKIRVS